jgi:hypothetical protein
LNRHAGKQAKILSDEQISDLLFFAETTRYPLRNRVIVLLSCKAGLRAGEIAKLTWDMVLDANGYVATSLELPNSAAKKGSGRRIPLPLMLRPIGVKPNPALRSSKGETLRQGQVEVHCTQTSEGHWECGCYDYDAGTCGPC